MGARSYRVSRVIDAPASVVWGLLTDAASYAQWNDAVVSLHRPIAEGETIELVSIASPKRTFKLRVSEMRPPTHMVWTDGMPLGLFKGERTYDIADLDGDHCEFTMVEEFSGPLAPLITRAIPDLTDSFAIFADSLKKTAEAQATAT